MVYAIGSGSNYGIYDRNVYNNYSQSAVSAIEATKKVTKQTGQYTATTTRQLNKDMTNFLNDYKNQFSSLKQASNQLRNYASGNVWDQTEAQVANGDILSVTTNFPSKMKQDLTVNVSQLAQQQVNVSDALDAGGTGQLTSGSLVLNSQGKSYQLSVDTANKSNREVLTDLAKQINSLSAGVNAAVQEKNGQVQLTLQGKSTGASNEFAVATDIGLDLQQTKQAQDAVYSINGETRRSATNQIAVDSYRVSGELKQTGSTKISFGANEKTIQSAVENMVSKYNDTIKMLNDNGERGSGVLQQLKSTLLPPISEKSMEAVGLSYNKDGTLRFNAAQFQKSYQQDPKQTQELLGGSYSVASGLSRKSDQAMARPSYTLINADQEKLQDFKKQQTEMLANLNNLPAGVYSRRGTYDLMNFGAMSMFLNIKA